MKLIRLRLLLILCVTYYVLSTSTLSKTKTETATNTHTHTNTKTQTQTKTKAEGKMSIFSYDLFSVMKKKMILMKSRANKSNTNYSNGNTYESVNRDTFEPLPPGALAPPGPPNAPVAPAAPSNPAPSSPANPTPSASAPAPSAPSAPAPAPITPAPAPTPPPSASAPSSSASAPSGQGVEIKQVNGPIFYSGWVKYFKYEDNDTHGKKPSSFFKNNEFFNQVKTFPGMDIKKKTDGLYDYVPNKSYWFATLFQDSLVISASKKESTRRVYEALNMSLLQPILEGNGFKGGILDFGSFSEGYCFKLATVSRVTWIFCTENIEDKVKFMTAVKSMKLMNQRAKGDIVLTPEKPKVETLDNILGRTPPEHASGRSSEKVDGYWIVLQDYSQCSKKCDTGVSTLHKLCIAPKNGGAPCEGQGILTKPCNPQPCPPSGSGSPAEQALANAQKPVVLKPIIKVMAYSNRPQRYHKCVIKEGDMMMLKTPDADPNTNPQSLSQNQTPSSKDAPPIQVPVRAFMNNRTLSFYENAEDFSSQYVTYNLKTADFARSKRDKNCWTISETKRTTELCPIGGDKKSLFYKEWDREFHIFKFNCETKPDEIEAELNKKLKSKMNNAKSDMLAEREGMLKERIHHKDEQHNTAIVKKTNKVAAQAIVKEMNLEEMIEQEEEEMEKKEESNIQIQIQKETKKNQCVMHAIKERELENQYQAKNNEAAGEVEEIKQQAMKEVTAKRNKLKERIAAMRKKAKRREGKLKAQLLNMRMSMANEMTNVYKDGDQAKCVAAIKDDKVRLVYCAANFTEINKFSQCKDNDDFCSMCCESEFGEMHMDKRNKCMKEVCESGIVKASGATPGRWVWATSGGR